MQYRLLADLVVLAHFAFVLLVIFGGLLVLRRPRFAWVHVPVALWGFVVEATGWICPLTPLENHFRALAGEAAYRGDFIERYVLHVMYPAGLTRPAQYVLAAVVLAINAAVYAVAIRRRFTPAKT